MITFKLSQSDEKTKTKIIDVTVPKGKKKERKKSSRPSNSKYSLSDYLINGADELFCHLIEWFIVSAPHDIVITNKE